MRIVAALIFITSGTTILFGFPAAMPGGMHAAFPSQIWFAGVLETFGGLCMLLGLCTRPVAFILSGMMAVAYFQVHFPQSFWPSINNGTPAVLFCFLWLYISAAGPGPLSLDAMLGKGSAPSHGA
jgi:putative oxidoreductase